MTERQLTAIEARHAAATPGPWMVTNRCGISDTANDAWPEAAQYGYDVDGPPEPHLRGMFALHADAAFIVGAHEDVPALCQALRAAWDALREAALERSRIAADLVPRESRPLPDYPAGPV